MNLLLLLQMAADGRGEQVAVVADGESLTAAELLAGAWAGAALVDPASTLVHVGTNGLAFPIGLFAAAAAGIPFVPLNYRLSDEQIDQLIAPLDAPVVLADATTGAALAARGHRVVVTSDLVAGARAGGDIDEVPGDADGAAVLLYTSGTTSAPKAAVLRHRNLTSYVITTVEYGGADPDEAVLVSVPPYHVAGLANLLSNLYLGRRIVYLRQFDAATWVATVRDEKITHAMVVPTMLARICDVLEADAEGLPSLRALSYGGARTPAPLLQRVIELLPEVDLTNAYGLTETSSTIAILGPDDHRAARTGDADAIARLSSAGRVLPTVELEIRDDETVLDSGGIGEIWVRGEQVSGEYVGREAPLDAAGWFPTRDRGWVDGEGYLFIEGRSDDTIIRGGENVAPAEVEEVLLQHADVDECAVVGVPDEEWGQRIAAVVVLRAGATGDAEAMREFVRASLRSSKTPDTITFVEALPYTETGKLLRRTVLSDVLGVS
jgi:acyl-CoA synthetase (AMP-forming)/AMP-acid ligase II